MKIKSLSWLSLSSMLCFSILLLSSCKKEEVIQTPVEFFNDGTHILSYQSKGDKIEFTFDAVGDGSNALNGTYPEVDTYRLYVDHNSNSLLDSGTDLLIGPHDDGRICVATLLSQNSTTGCEFLDNVTGEGLFSATENSQTNHVSYSLSIPKSVLSDGNSANVYIEILDGRAGWQYFPSYSAELFDNFFEVTW